MRSLIDKGGDLPREGGTTQKAGLAHAPLGASLTDRNGLTLVEGVGYATGFGEVTAAAIALDPLLLRAWLGWFIAVRQIVIGKGRLRRTIREVVGALQVIAGVGLWAVE